ncbi:MAG: hypothetical protein NTY77_05655 [Elusimicrobia bacterium]|nr:hypothetical protein [Elusimicrobiota bacterium]
MKIGELFVELGITGDSVSLRDFIGKMGDLKASTIGELAALTSLGAGFMAMAGEFSNAAVGFKLFEGTTGLAADELQRWQRVADQAGSSGQAVLSSVSNLQAGLARFQLGDQSIFKPFMLLGIDPTGMDAIKLLPVLRKKFRTLAPALQKEIAGMLGIDPSLLLVFNKTDAEFRKLLASYQGMNAEQRKLGMDMHESMSAFQGALLQVKRSLVESFGPDYAKMLKASAEWLKTNEAQVWALRLAFAAIAIAVIPLVFSFGALAAAALAIGWAVEKLYEYYKKGVFKEIGQGLKSFWGEDADTKIKQIGSAMDIMNRGSLNRPNVFGSLGIPPLSPTLAMASAGGPGNTKIDAPVTIHAEGGDGHDIKNALESWWGNLMHKTHLERNNGHR